MLCFISAFNSLFFPREFSKSIVFITQIINPMFPLAVTLVFTPSVGLVSVNTLAGFLKVPEHELIPYMS